MITYHNNLSSYQYQRCREIADLIPKICEILSVEPIPIVNFDLGVPYLGIFWPHSNAIGFNPEFGDKIICGSYVWPYWARLEKQIRPYKPDIYIHSIAHELAHWKQYKEGKLTHSDGVCYWKGKQQPIYFYGTNTIYPKSYQDLPQERDANSWATYVTKELHREKYLY